MIQIRHQIRGRMRLRIPSLYRSNAPMGQRLEERLGTADGIIRVQTNSLCASLVVHYNVKRLSPDLLSRNIAVLLGERLVAEPLVMNTSPIPAGMVSPLSGAVSAWIPGNGNASIECAACEPATRPEKGEYFWIERIGTFVLLTGHLGYLLVREYIIKRPLPQSPLSLTGIVSLVAAFPLLNNAWKETFGEKRFTIHQFLAFSLLLGIFMGEAATAFEIIYVLRGGMLLEEYVANRSRRAIHKMLELSVKDARVLVEGAEIEVPLDTLQRGDLVVVRTGEKIPVDGDIERGEVLLDEATITRKSELAYKNAGDKVFASSYLDKGVLYVNALRVGGDTYLAHISALVDASLDQKAPLQERADELAARLLKLGIMLTLSTLLITRSFYRAFTVMLVMSCPCATILAASTAVSTALHNAARRQILIKGGAYLENIGDAEVYCFDKTGTITTEEPVVASVVSDDEMELLYWAASAELQNLHALAGAILWQAGALGIEPEQHSMSEHILGQGIKATVDDSVVLLCNRRMMLGEHIDPADYTRAAQRLIEQGQTAVYVALDGRLLGRAEVAPPPALRSEADRNCTRSEWGGISRLQYGN